MSTTGTMITCVLNTIAELGDNSNIGLPFTDIVDNVKECVLNCNILPEPRNIESHTRRALVYGLQAGLIVEPKKGRFRITANEVARDPEVVDNDQCSGSDVSDDNDDNDNYNKDDDDDYTENDRRLDQHRFYKDNENDNVNDKNIDDDDQCCSDTCTERSCESSCSRDSCDCDENRHNANVSEYGDDDDDYGDDQDIEKNIDQNIGLDNDNDNDNDDNDNDNDDNDNDDNDDDNDNDNDMDDDDYDYDYDDDDNDNENDNQNDNYQPRNRQQHHNYARNDKKDDKDDENDRCRENTMNCEPTQPCCPKTPNTPCPPRSPKGPCEPKQPCGPWSPYEPKNPKCPKQPECPKEPQQPIRCTCCPRRNKCQTACKRDEPEHFGSHKDEHFDENESDDFDNSIKSYEVDDFKGDFRENNQPQSELEQIGSTSCGPKCNPSCCEPSCGCGSCCDSRGANDGQAWGKKRRQNDYENESKSKKARRRMTPSNKFNTASLSIAQDPMEEFNRIHYADDVDYITDMNTSLPDTRMDYNYKGMQLVEFACGN